MVIIWYLIIAYYHGGSVAVPEPSKEECRRLADFARDQPLGGARPITYCIPGVK